MTTLILCVIMLDEDLNAFLNVSYSLFLLHHLPYAILCILMHKSSELMTPHCTFNVIPVHLSPMLFQLVEPHRPRPTGIANAVCPGNISSSLLLWSATRHLCVFPLRGFRMEAAAAGWARVRLLVAVFVEMTVQVNAVEESGIAVLYRTHQLALLMDA